MKISLYKTGKLTGLNYVKTLLRSNALLIIEIIDNYCFLCSIITSLHFVKIAISTRYLFINIISMN